ncbi:hypothetical protein Pan241w_14560 [Gimesia alba]|uniref:Uncharacterized protein n=1 Tax=Gimesia alba TaxID=2527973 RepID=A0A517RC14_9PLAN|nr:hypothetical protein Pan241w_14560 [Gimesia alba]
MNAGRSEIVFRSACFFTRPSSSTEQNLVLSQDNGRDQVPRAKFCVVLDLFVRTKLVSLVKIVSKHRNLLLAALGPNCIRAYPISKTLLGTISLTRGNLFFFSVCRNSFDLAGAAFEIGDDAGEGLRVEAEDGETSRIELAGDINLSQDAITA